MEFRILGPVELRARGELHTPGWAKERCVLASLLLAVGRPVTAEALIGRLWEDDPPGRARALLHTQITRLRRRLQALDGDVRLEHRSGAYVLVADPEQIDYQRFRLLRAQARSIAASGDPAHAVRLLREAAELWRGEEPLTGVPGSWAEMARRTISEELLGGALDRVGLELEDGRHAEVVAELAGLAARFPYNEKPVELLMLALHRCGRSGDAVQAYERLRRRLDAELGLSPGRDAAALHRRILAGDPALLLADRPRPDGRPPNDLPRDVHTFTGRAAELERLTALAEDGEDAVAVLALDGMPGVGKTVLAVHLAHRLAARYPDGQVFLALHAHQPGREPLDPSSALERLLIKLRVHRDRIPPGLEDRAALWRDELAGRRVLLVLDDAVGNEQVRHLLPGAPGCLAVVTSRRRLTGLDAARPVSLEVPAPGEAAELLARVAGGRVSADDPAVREAARLCGHLPLALQLAGNRLLHRAAWTAADLAERLREGGGRLAEIRAENRELTAAFRLSFEGLGERERDAFRILGLHPGDDLTAADAAVLLGTSRAGAEAVLDGLLDHHLLSEQERGRYRFHDLIREYAARLAEDVPAPERDAALERLLDHYLATAGRADRLVHPGDDRPAGPPPTAGEPAGTPEEARRWLADETGNLLRAAAYASENGRPAFAARLAAVLGRYLEGAGRWTEAAALHERAVTAWRALGDEGEAVRALADLSKVAWRTGEYGRALDAAGEGLVLARAREDRRSTAVLLNQHGLIHWHRSEYDVATGYFEQALAIHRERGDDRGEAEVLNNLGIVLWHLGRYDASAESLRAALALYENAGERRGRQVTLSNIGFLEAGLGHYDTALDHYRRADDAIEMRRQDRAIWINNVATVYRKLGRAGRAIEEYRKALSIYREIGDRRGECDSLNHIGACFAELGRDGEALIHHQKALNLSRDLLERFEEAAALRSIGEVHLRAGRHRVAAEQLEASLGLARAIGDAYQEARALDGLAEVAAQTRDEGRARSHRRRALDLYDALGVPEADALRARLLGPSDASGA